MRHTPFFDEIVNRRHLIERLMNSFGEIENYIIRKMRMEKGFIMDNIQMVVYKFFLDRPVISLNNAVDLGTPRIDKQMGNICFLQSLIEFPKILCAVVRLPVLDLQGVNCTEPFIEILHVFAVEALVVER